MRAGHDDPAPADWLLRWAHLLPAGGSVLDLACGSGRNLRWLAARGWRCTGVDRDAAALARSAGLAELLQADIESGPWPLADRQFDAVAIFNYLWRPLWPRILDALAPGGVLVYQTFADGNQMVGKPSRPDFLLQPGELLARCATLRVVAYEDGFEASPPRFVQRVVAVRTEVAPAADAAPRRYPLRPPVGRAVAG